MTTASISPLPVEQNAADVRWWAGTIAVFELVRFTAKLMTCRDRVWVQAVLW